MRQAQAPATDIQSAARFAGTGRSMQLRRERWNGVMCFARSNDPVQSLWRNLRASQHLGRSSRSKRHFRLFRSSVRQG